MELSKINELMAERGYTQPIGAIFPDWEFIKDEILLPNRKSGKGNGTVHVYLLEDNMNIFQECFPEYIKTIGQGSVNANDSCPHIKHFVMTANVLTAAGIAYSFYKFDDDKFDYKNYIHTVLKHDNQGMLVFNSLFKLSTDSRPYFKQFDRDIFGKIIRYVFVPKQTAYKLYLYSDEDYSNFCVFWIIGQLSNDSFIIESENTNKIVEANTANIQKEKTQISTKNVSSKDFTLTVEEEMQKNQYNTYLRSIGKSEVSITSYTNVLWKKLSNLIRDYYQANFRNIFAISNVTILMKIENDIWRIQAIMEADKASKGRLKEALSKYVDFVQSKLSNEELAQTLFANSTEPSFSMIEEQIGKKQQYTTHIPVYSIRAACGRFEDEENAEIEGWIDVSQKSIKISKDLFIIHAKGDSMEPTIHDGDLCVFKWYDGSDIQDSIVLTQLSANDSDYDGLYTIKKFHAENSFDPYGHINNNKIELRSLNPKYHTITLGASTDNDLKTIGIFIKTL